MVTVRIDMLVAQIKEGRGGEESSKTRPPHGRLGLGMEIRINLLGRGKERTDAAEMGKCDHPTILVGPVKKFIIKPMWIDCI